MTDREKVMQWLETCVSGCEEGCPYEYKNLVCRVECKADLMRDALALLKEQEPITGETSDGYHTFNELYHHRAVLFSVIVANYPDRAWKSKKHHDGTMYNGMFIVGIDTPDGQATYHYDVDPYWDMFKCRVLDNAPEWDGHTPAQAIERIGKLKAQEPRVMTQEEVWSLPEGSVAWFEERDDGGRTYIQPMMSNGKAFMIGTHLDINVSRGSLNWSNRRFWTARPTDEQRKAVKWE